jgi:hypothetical protein
LHCRKTAGSSVKAYLNKHLGYNDLQVGAWKETLKNGGMFNRRFFKDIVSPKSVSSIEFYKSIYFGIKSGKKIVDILSNIQKKIYSSHFLYPDHATAREVKSFLGKEWDKYFKFCFVRNPFEKVVSDYIYTTRNGREDISFQKFVEMIKKRGENKNAVHPRIKSWNIVSTEKGVEMDYVGRYEILNKDLENILNKIGINFEGEKFPYTKNIKSYDYRDYYGEEEKNIVSNLFGEEIEYFGYEMG